MHVLWKGYALIFCGIQAINLVNMEWAVKDVAFLAWYTAGCAALIGYAFNIKVAIPIVWKVYFSVLVVAASFFAAMLMYGALNGASPEVLQQAALLLLPQVPFWYAVWAYAYRSKQVWQQGV